MKTKYDLIVPIGEDCHCSMSLRRAGLQLLSLPIDWIGLNPEDGIKTHSCPGARVDAICTDFAGLFEKDDFRLIGPPAKYENARTGWQFWHDFRPDTPFDVAYPSFRAKYDRRIARFHELAARAGKMLFVQLDRPTQTCPSPLGDFHSFHERLSAKFPGKRVDCLVIRLDRNRPAEQAQLAEPEPGVFLLEFDYSHRIPDKPLYEPNFDAVTKVLRRHFAVRDYRPSKWRRLLDGLLIRCCASSRRSAPTRDAGCHGAPR